MAKAKAPAAKGKGKTFPKSPATKVVPKKRKGKSKPGPVPLKNAKREYARKLKICTAICESYATGEHNLESLCAANGIDRRTFYNWRVLHDEVREMWLKSESDYQASREQSIGEAAIKSMLKLVEGYEYEETQTVGKVVTITDEETGKPSQQIVPHRIVKTKHHVSPSPGMVAMAMRNLHGWRDRLDIKHSGTITTRQVMVIGGKEIEF